ncbi:hypothetical protein M0805_004782 [Coniferiporia weirii]|nr:hypothetical protein M0805_004782 [Coniferiporia weirii]
MFFPLFVAAAQARTYPSSLTLTSDVAFADILADIPFFAVGLVAFGVFTFFFVMRRINWLTTHIHFSVFLAFLAAIFDLSQIVRRGYWEVTHDLGVSSVGALVILRELSHASSIGMRYLFFWMFTAEPPRGELPLVPILDERRPNFISLESDSALHSGNWERWSYLGSLVKWALLLLTLAVPVLQALWRLVDAFNSEGSIYLIEESIQMSLSVAFILKLFVNTVISPLTPRWKTLRDYSPVLLALLFGMGVVAGNFLCFRFSETTLGRFLQAVELYILILFVLISAFYKVPVRSSVIAELVRRKVVAAGYRDVEADNAKTQQTQFSMMQGPSVTNGELRESDSAGRLSQSGRLNIAQRISRSSIFSSRITSRLQGSIQVRQENSNGEGDQRRLWNRDEAERGVSPGGQTSIRASLEQTPSQTPVVEAKEAPGWRDPVLTSVVGDEQGVRVMKELEIRPSATPTVGVAVGKAKRMSIPQIIESSDDASVYTTDFDSRRSRAGPAYTRNATDSPVYGLDGIIRNLQIGAASTVRESNISSARSSGIESLLRQQQELEKSIAGLRVFSPGSDSRPISRMQSDSLRSEFSLSNFPEPPFFATSEPDNAEKVAMDKDAVPASEDARDLFKNSMAISMTSDNSLMVDDVSFQLVPPRMPAALEELSGRSQNLSVPSMARESLDSVFDTPGPSRAVRLDSQGTQYDVTSFIGGLTAPGSDRYSPLAGIAERERSTDSDTDSVIPATIAEITRVQVVEGRRPAEAADVDAGREEASNLPPTNESPPSLTVTPDPAVSSSSSGTAQRQPQHSRPLHMQGALGFGRGRGLPTGPRGRLEISNPLPRSPDLLEEQAAFQRPRPAPLVLQDGSEPQPPTSDPPQNGGYF